MIDELSIIIPTLNEEHYIPKLLNSLVAQHFPGKLQIIIVDGGSTDKTIQKTKEFSKVFPELLILKTHTGIGHQRNKGAEHARYKYLLFIDADIIVTPGVLEKIAKTFYPKDRFVANPLFLPNDGNLIALSVFFVTFMAFVVMSFFRPVTPGAFLFTSLENHTKIRGFREDAVSGEDADYGDRSRQQGATYYLLFRCVVFHSCRRTRIRGMLHMIISYIGMYRYYLKNGPITNKSLFDYAYGEY